MHLNFEPNGKVVPCCLTSAHNYFAGDLNKDSIEKIEQRQHEEVAFGNDQWKRTKDM